MICIEQVHSLVGLDNGRMGGDSSVHSIGNWHGKLILLPQNFIGHQVITMDHNTNNTYTQNQ